MNVDLETTPVTLPAGTWQLDVAVTLRESVEEPSIEGDDDTHDPEEDA